VSPGGDHVAALDYELLRLWDVETRRQLGPPIQGVVGGGTLAYLDDGHTLVTPGSSGALFLDLDPESWRATACRLAARNLTSEEWATYLPDEPPRPTC
jgi:hypothetical protein